jgi:hypothetical protein
MPAGRGAGGHLDETGQDWGTRPRGSVLLYAC